MAHLYADENFPLPVIEELRRLGHNVITLYDAGQANQSLSDETVLTLACSENRVLLTHNRKHFIRLHRIRPDHFGMIVCTFDPDFVGQARRIHTAIQQKTQLSSQLIRIYRPA